MWYGSATAPVEAFGPTRYMWDLGLYNEATETIVQTEGQWSKVPDKLADYDYFGQNPAKGGLFRTGPMVYGDGIAIGWLGHPEFRLGDGTLVYSRRMPSFFETFPTLFVDASGVVRADQPFRRAESKYALESKKLRVTFRGGALDGVSVSNRLTVATLARSAQFGELLDFDRESVSADGVLRTSPRGWYTFAHLCFGLLFFFGHWWHASRALYRDLIAGLEAETGSYIEFGSYARVGG